MSLVQRLFSAGTGNSATNRARFVLLYPDSPESSNFWWVSKLRSFVPAECSDLAGWRGFLLSGRDLC